MYIVLDSLDYQSLVSPSDTGGFLVFAFLRTFSDS